MDKHSPNILVVDDNEYLCDILAILLTRNGCNPSIAENGAVGLQKYLENPDHFDMILLDVHMPVMNGFEVLKCIRESERGTAIPVIAMSGTFDEYECKGFSHYLRKPFEFDEVLSVLANHLP